MIDDPRRRLGALGERLAGEHLERAGYEILERNFSCALGEVDLVAATPDALVFCEVKTRVAGGRAGPATPLDAIGPVKRRRLRGSRPPGWSYAATSGPSGRLCGSTR